MAGDAVGEVFGRGIDGIGGAFGGGCNLASGGGGGGGGTVVGERCGGGGGGDCFVAVVAWGAGVMLDVVLSDGECWRANTLSLVSSVGLSGGCGVRGDCGREV